ncbi:MAG: GuaB3 family IMP dehydrogenase-related protein [Candidatus Rokuibacteriota bacterium]|nr:MAG: GuaB3 family IMP dehydrogenase-related protein [Candidatus Rokubacteria bacterium]
MGMWVGRGRKARVAYGFDDIALVPGTVTVNPNEVDVSWELCGRRIELPILAAAMDGVSDPRFAIEMGRLGGMAVLNLEGIQTRYENPDEVVEQIISSSAEESTRIIKEDLVHRRVSEIKKGGGLVAVSSIPQRANRFAKLAEEAGADFFVVQSTVTTARHIATEYEPLDFRKLKRELAIPLIVGNCVTFEATLELMQTGVDALLIGVGPGAACTTREVLGLGVPQVTATADAAAARDFHYKQSGRYVPIITDGGMSTGGDICKALASGADAVMIGSAFARALEAPGRGYHWGMATPHSNLPRGTRIRVGVVGPLTQILFGPAFTDDGTMNLMGALRTGMGSLGARTIRELQITELIIAPAMKTEGKVFQKAQRVGMGK